MTGPETPLGMTARHVAEGAKRVARQRVMVARLAHQPSEQVLVEAEKLLTNLEVTLALAREHLRLEQDRARR